MATVALTTSPVQIDDGTSYTVLVTNTGATPVDLSRGGRLRPGQTQTVYPEGAALTAAATSGAGMVTTATTAKPLPNPSDPAALAARPEFTGTYASPQGAWSSATAYTVNQVVTYNGGTYRAKAASTNVIPGTDATRWESWGGGGGGLQPANNLSDLANAATARTNLGLGGAAVLNVGATSSTVAAGNAPAIAAASATLGEAFGATSGVPISPWAASPTIGAELWALANFQSGAGYNSSTLAPSITANSTQFTNKTRVAVNLGGSSDNLANNDTVFRLEFDYASTISTGWRAISLLITDSSGTALSGTAEQFIVTGGSPNTSGHYAIDFQPINEGSTSYIELRLAVWNNATSGTITITNASLKRVGRASRPMLISKQYNTGTYPLIYWQHQDTATGAWKMAELNFWSDGNLTNAYRDFNAYTTDQPFLAQIPDPTLAKTGGTQTTSVGNQQTTVSPYSLRVQNNDQIMEVWNGSAWELRCNTHNGEYNDGTPTWAVDRGAGFASWTLAHGLDPVRRVQVTMPTYVCRSVDTQDKAHAFATTNHVFTMFPDGMVRCDRTTTFLSDQTYRQFFEWMSSHDTTTPYLGRLGRGLTVIGEVDTHNKAVAPTLTPSTSTSGGTLAATTYSYLITAVTPYGESTPSAAVTQATTGTTSTVTLTWSAASNASGYRIYGRTAGVERLLATVGAVTTWTDDGSPGIQPVAPPAVNTARYYSGQNAADNETSTDATWAVWYEPRSGFCLGNIYDRDTVLQRSGVSAIRTRLEKGSGIQKIYNNLWWTAGDTRTITAGTVWTATHWTFCYLPRRAEQYHEEIAYRAANLSALASVYPNT